MTKWLLPSVLEVSAPGEGGGRGVVRVGRSTPYWECRVTWLFPDRSINRCHQILTATHNFSLGTNKCRYIHNVHNWAGERIGHREELGAGKNWAQGRKNVGENWVRERGKKVPVMSQHTESFNFIILRLLTSLNIITWLSFQRKTVSLSLELLLTPAQIVFLHKHRVVSQSH